MRRETFLCERFLSPSLVSVSCSSRGAELTAKGFRSPLQSDPSGRIYTPLSRSALFPCFCFSPPSRLPHGVSSSCLAAAPSKTQRPFSNVVPLSPSSPSLLPNLAGSFAALSCFLFGGEFLISWYCSVHVCVRVCVQRFWWCLSLPRKFEPQVKLKAMFKGSVHPNKKQTDILISRAERFGGGRINMSLFCFRLYSHASCSVRLN